MNEAQMELYLNNLKQEIDNCNKKIEEASRLQEQANHRKYGLITARDHFIAIKEEIKR